MGEFENTRMHVLHFSNDPADACTPPGNWTSEASQRVRKLLDASGYTPLCQQQLDELEGALEPRLFQWLSTPIEAILFARSGRSWGEMEAVWRALQFRLNEHSFVDYSLSSALSRESCNDRPPALKEWCIKLAGKGYMGTAPDLDRPMTSIAGGQAPIQKAVQVLAAEAGFCKGLAAPPPPPLGWALPRDNVTQMRCLAAKLTVPALLRRQHVTAP